MIDMTSPVPPLVTELQVLTSLPLDQHPAAVYLASLSSERSRRVTAQALRTVAALSPEKTRVRPTSLCSIGARCVIPIRQPSAPQLTAGVQSSHRQSAVECVTRGAQGSLAAGLHERR